MTARAGNGGLAFVVQSAVKPPLGVSERIQSFVASMEEKIAALTAEEFAILIAGVKTSVKEKDTDIFIEAQRYDDAIATTYQFDKKQLRIEDIDAVTKEEFIEFASNLLYK